jgi:hypothetical protein
MPVSVGLNVWSRLMEDTFPYLDAPTDRRGRESERSGSRRARGYLAGPRALSCAIFSFQFSSPVPSSLRLLVR